MKIYRWIGAIVLLMGLVVSTAGAATALSDGSTFYGNGFGIADGTIIDDPYDFTLTEDLLAVTDVNYTTLATTFAELTFTWSITGGADVFSVQYTDVNGDPTLASSPFSFPLLGSIGAYTLTVTGKVLNPDNLNLQTMYSFGIETTAVPIPAAFWLFGSALVGFIGFGRRRSVA